MHLFLYVHSCLIVKNKLHSEKWCYQLNEQVDVFLDWVSISTEGLHVNNKSDNAKMLDWLENIIFI